MSIGDIHGVMRFQNLNDKELEELREKANKVINRPLPKELIKQREGGGKKMLSYIEGETVIRLLNEAFGSIGWSFQIINKCIIPSEPKGVTNWNAKTHKVEKVLNEDGTQKMESQPPVVEVHGRLIVPGFGVREQFGTKIILGGSTEQEGAAKAAATDALKKCATLFGIGIELYDNSEPAPTPAPKQTTSYNANNSYNNRPSTPPTPKPTPEPALEWPAAETEKLKKIKESLKILDNVDLNPYVAEFTGNPNGTWQMIGPTNIASFNKFLEKKFFK